jgi:hypothetical protein
MAPISVPCPALNQCKYKTPELEFTDSVALIAMPERQAHRGNMVATQQGGGKQPEEFPRPAIGLDETKEKWQTFQAHWLQYKEEYGLQGKGLITQLYACCSSELATALSRVTGRKHYRLDEDTLLTQIKELTVYSRDLDNLPCMVGTEKDLSNDWVEREDPLAPAA